MTTAAPADALFELGGGRLRLLRGAVGHRAARNRAALRRALAWVRAQNRRGRWVAAAFDYELGAALEPAVGRTPATPRPLARFWAFAAATDLDADAAVRWLDAAVAQLPAAARVAGVTAVEAGLDAQQHAAAVARIKTLIAAGDCYQVNFTFPIRMTPYGDPLALYARLRARQPTDYGACLRHDDGAIVSLSPELFVARSGPTLRVRPMKGTAARGADGDEDARRRLALAASEKDRAENVMIVDLLRNDLGRVSVPGSVRVTGLCEVEAYPSVLQMTSSIEAQAATDDVYAQLAALFPCGSVTGAPKIRAMQLIAELEAAPRGLYCGSVGYFAPDGDFRLNVAIRTFEMRGGGATVLPVGSGIVADSRAADEYRECLSKAAFLTGLPPPFALIETMRLEHGVFPLGDGHRKRLARSASELGFACCERRLRVHLDELAARHSTGVWRVRLRLAADGAIDTAVSPLEATPAPVCVGLAGLRIDARSLLRRHKTSARADYDDELHQAIARGEFDALVVNDQGAIAEGLRSNVFVRRRPGAPWLTPPLGAGALPGVLRADLIAQGLAIEAALGPDDLLSGDCCVGNALRGLLPARLSAAAVTGLRALAG